MALAQQWRDLQSELAPDWSSVQLRLTVDDPAATARAAALLGPAQPVRPEANVLRFASGRAGAAQGPDAVSRLLERLDRERIAATLALVSSQAALAPAADEHIPTLVEGWEAQLATLPADWSDVFAEIDLLSTDYLERAAVLCVPINPRREGTTTALRFRVARVSGYGASAGMVRRCLERCDGESLIGSLNVLAFLCDSKHVGTQGPVWMLDGRNV
jgi:hypothetical protein